MSISTKFKSLPEWIIDLRLRTKLLACTWVLFFLLVGLGVHGSSTAITADWWAPERAYTGYLFGGPAIPSDRSGNTSDVLKTDPLLSPIQDTANPRSLLMRNAREIRWDELVVATPWALSQLAHKPAFPVVNKNIGSGQNMLVTPHAPVWHIATLARPGTWGYFFLGAQRGLAWYWWFYPFACFTVLCLLFEIALGGHSLLAAFGAFWFCNSAYVICWSLWPSQVIFFACLGCLAAYLLLTSGRRSVQLTSAVLFGLAVPGFVMFLYPPWQVPAAYFVLVLFASFIIRDRLYTGVGRRLKERSRYLAAAMLIAAGLTLAWVITCAPDLKAMSDAVYPGRRISVGGDYSLAALFKGFYNLSTIYNTPAGLKNQSESSSFFYLFPAVWIGLCLSKEFLKRFGALDWALLGYIAIAVIFLFVGLPPIISRLTLLSYVPSYRADLGIGLASILLALRVLLVSTDVRLEAKTVWNKIWPGVAGLAMCLLLLWHAQSLMKETGGFPSKRLGILTALSAGVASYCFLAGHKKVFCAVVITAVVSTTALFNPLSTNLSHLYDSALSREIKRLNQESPTPPLWICFGGDHTGVLITVLGGRSMSGIHWPPQLKMWRVLDPAHLYEKAYNQYAEVSLDYLQDASRVSFSSPHDGELRVFINPDNVGLKTLGARYLLLADAAEDLVPTNGFRFIAKTSNGRFSIFEFPNIGTMGP